MKKEIEIREDSGTVFASLFGEIDHHTAKGEREEIDEMLFKRRPELLILDFSEVRFMDSSGIGLIIGRAEVCTGLKCRVLLKGLSEALRKLVRLSGIEKIKCISVESK